MNYAGLDYYLANVQAAVERAKVPVALHLDHGSSYGLARHALRTGYTSIMIDGSHEGYEENIAVIKAVADDCAPSGIPVEAEQFSIKDNESMYSQFPYHFRLVINYHLAGKKILVIFRNMGFTRNKY